jgi:hypothetical protein
MGNERISFNMDAKLSFGYKDNNHTKDTNLNLNPATTNNNPFVMKKPDGKNDISIISDRTAGRLVKEEKENLRYQSKKIYNLGNKEVDVSTNTATPLAQRLVNNLNQNQAKNQKNIEISLKDEKEMKVTESNKNEYISTKKSSKNLKMSESPQNSFHGSLNNNKNIKEETEKNFQSRNEKLISNNKKVQNDATILSFMDNPNLMKDITVDSNILSTNREHQLKERANQMIQKKVNESEQISIDNGVTDRKKIDESFKSSTLKIEKQPAASDVENKRAKFFNKLSGMIQNQSKDILNDNVEKKGLSQTMKPLEQKKSININSLIKNLENHMSGKICLNKEQT